MLAFLGIGTNLGNKEANIARCLQLLGEQAGTMLCSSSYYYSEPWGFQSDNGFLNVVVALETPLSPILLLQTTQSIEQQMGRTGKSVNKQYHDRIIDIDILLYGNQPVCLPHLHIPHPAILQRDFVRIPLWEVLQKLVNYINM